MGTLIRAFSKATPLVDFGLSSHLRPFLFGKRSKKTIWMAMLIAAVVVIPRTVLILHAHSEYLDDPAHVRRGLSFVTGNPADMYLMMNDPPLGDGILVLPLVATGCFPSKPIHWENWPGGKPVVESEPPEKLAWKMRTERSEILYGHWLRPETILMMIGVWKAILFVPFAGLVFYWCRQLYGTASGWLALGLLLVEPTFAAHIPPAALDVMAVEAIVLALFVGWKYFEKPTTWRLIATAFLTAVALSIKHTAIILPGVMLVYAGLHWIVRPWMQRQEWREWKGKLRNRVDAMLLAGFVVIISMWALTGFDFSRPRQYQWPLVEKNDGRFSIYRDVVDPLLDNRWPGGIYVGSFIGGMKHASLGHWNFLLGRHEEHGWWYYFPVVATFKIPIGIWIVMAMGVLSLIWVRPKWEEWALVVPMVAWMALMMASSINIGFRHFLPIYIFILMLGSRCVAHFRYSERYAAKSPSGTAIERSPMDSSRSTARNDGSFAEQTSFTTRKIFLVAVWLMVLATFLDTLRYHPDYMSYVNWPRHKPWLSISDSNIDWGQSLKQVRTWIDSHGDVIKGRPVYLLYFWNEREPGIRYYLGDRVVPINRWQPHPEKGILIASPTFEASLYDTYDAYGTLRPQEPIAIIGHNMLVYDMDVLRAKGVKWPTTAFESMQWRDSDKSSKD